MPKAFAEKIDDREYKVIIPKRDNKGQRIKNEEIESFVLEFSDHFDGATIQPTVIGCWRHPDKPEKTVCEENLIMSAVRDSEKLDREKIDPEKQAKKDLTFVRDLSERIGDRFGQFGIFYSKELTEIEIVPSKGKEEIPKERLGLDLFKKLI